VSEMWNELESRGVWLPEEKWTPCFFETERTGYGLNWSPVN